MAANLRVKLTQHRITMERTKNIFDSNRRETIERHRKALKTITNSVNEIRLTIEESKVKTNEDIAEITK